MVETSSEHLALTGTTAAKRSLDPMVQLALVAGGGLVLVPVLSGALAQGLSGGVGLSVLGYLVGAVLAAALMRRGYPHATLGLCNVVTLFRLTLVAALLAPLAGGTAPWGVVVAIAALALSLDGVGGWLARRAGHVSDFGARLDMEVDAALAMILALNAWAAGTTGAVVLMLALPRYAFAAAALCVPWLDRPVPDRLSRKAVCVLQLSTLIVLQIPPFADAVPGYGVAAVGAALLWSFARDVVWLWQTARPAK